VQPERQISTFRDRDLSDRSLQQPGSFQQSQIAVDGATISLKPANRSPPVFRRRGICRLPGAWEPMSQESFFETTAMPSSLSCLSLTEVSASIIGSMALAVLGNGMTSRRLVAPGPVRPVCYCRAGISSLRSKLLPSWIDVMQAPLMENVSRFHSECSLPLTI
jgi:hypothetical protein